VPKPSVSELKEICRQVRRDIIVMTNKAGSGHPGGSLSAVETLVALYFAVMKCDPANPTWPERDYFILSKGHACPVVYATLAEKGYFPKEELWTLRKFGSILQGHPHRLKTPGIEASTGSLGQGLSIASGIALGLKKDGKPNRVYCLTGDGEQNEGQIWEAGMSAAHYGLDNLTAICDRNYLMIDGNTENVMALDPLDDKWRAFGWHVIDVADGNDVEQMVTALEHAKRIAKKPTMIIANTIKGKGVSFMENQAGWHGLAPNDEQTKVALAELGFTE
jgi:transketolase